MKKKIFSTAIFCSLFTCSLSLATTYDIYVTDFNDSVTYRSWWYGGNAVWSDNTVNPNVVSHSYEPGNGNVSWSTLIFDLSSLSILSEDITSASFNFDILSVWTDGRNDIGTFTTGDQVLFSNGIGWKSFNITDGIKSAIENGNSSLTYTLNYTGYSGFTFGSADGEDPAFLRIITSSDDNPTSSPVPEPTTMLLFGTGLIGLASIGRKRTN